MAHEVWFYIPERKLGKADIEFYVRRDDQRLGTLKISKGSLVWFPKDAKVGYKAFWDEFDEFMRARPEHERKR